MTSIKIKSSFDFKNLSGDLVWEITKIWLFNSSEDAIEQAREKAPYETGKLKQSISREPQNVTQSTRKVLVWPRKVVYAQRREYENFKNPDRKFYMKKTFQALPNTIEENFNNAVKIVLKKNWLQ